MENKILTKEGRLRKKFQPAMYLDSTVVIDYWRVESLKIPEKDYSEEIIGLDRVELNKWFNDQLKVGNHEKVDRVLEKYNNPETFFLRELFTADKRLKKVIDIRDKIHHEEINVLPIVSPLALNELMKWNSEVIFKQVASEAVGTKIIQQIRQKDVGLKLKKMMEIWKSLSPKEREESSNNWRIEGLKRIYYDLWLNPSFLYAHGLKGLLNVDIKNFNLPMEDIWTKTSTYSFLQLGATDIMHILFAKHLGCDYIASFDSDFTRARDVIKEETGIEVLYGPDEILKVL